MSDLRKLQSDPGLFRKALKIDCDGRPKRLAEVLDPWQRDDFAALDGGWKRVAGQQSEGKQRAWLERPRGHSKTNDIAVMVGWAMFASKRMLKGYVLAGDQDQARLLRDAVEGLLRLNPWLRAILQADRFKIVNQRTGSVCEVLTSDAPTSYGLTPDFIVADEVCHWRGRELFDSAMSSAAKRAACMVVCISNAGFMDSWQWTLREAVRTDSAWYFSRLDGPRASWITKDRLEEQRRLLPRIAFDRLWLNKWSSGSGDALESADIDNAIRLKGPITGGKRGWRFVAGLDLGLRRDASALCIVGQHVGWSEEVETPVVLSDKQRMLIEAGVIEQPEPEYDVLSVGGTAKLRVASVDVWEPGRDRVSIEEIEARILQLDEAFKLDCLAADQWQAAQLCERLNKAGIPTEPIDFTPSNLKSMATAVLESFSEGNIELFDHAKLVADLRALRVVEKSYGIRLEPGQTASGTKHGDAATALALALLAADRNRRFRPREVSGSIIAA